MLPILILQAADDDELRDQDRRLLVLLHRHLDYYEYRPLKLSIVRRMLRMRNGEPLYVTHASSALRRLVKRGYLDRGPRNSFSDRVQTYRLRASRPQLHPVVTPPAA
jgi:hypothetical protein